MRLQCGKGVRRQGEGATESEKRLRTRRTRRMPLMRAGSDAILFLVLLSFTHVAAAFVAKWGKGCGKVAEVGVRSDNDNATGFGVEVPRINKLAHHLVAHTQRHTYRNTDTHTRCIHTQREREGTCTRQLIGVFFAAFIRSQID